MVGMCEGTHFDHNRSSRTYTFGHGCIEFFSADNSDKVKGAQRDILFINECNHIKFDTYRQLAVRTAKTIFIDFNPTSRFWFEDKGIETQDTTITLHSTYKDNPFLPAEQVAEIESNKGDEAWWRVYGLGETGNVEGLVYTNYDVVTQMPVDYKREFFCVDFGFTNDQTAIIKCRLAEGELWVDELRYDLGMDYEAIANALKHGGATKFSDIVCDSAEPRGIDYINKQGLRAVPSVKGQGSVAAGISVVRKYKLHITARSLGIIKELRNYMWRTDTDGGYTNEPIDKYNHALDALRYGVTKFLWGATPKHRPKVGLTFINRDE